MWTFSQTHANKEEKVLSWNDFPPSMPRPGEAMVPHIASYLRSLLENYEESEFIKYLVAPSPIALSGFFQCAETEIYSALQDLQRQGYEAETSGSAAPVILWDPLIRRKTVQRKESAVWQQFYQMLAMPSTQTVTG